MTATLRAGSGWEVFAKVFHKVWHLFQRRVTVLYRVFALALVLVVALVVTPSLVLAEEKGSVQEGTIVKVADGKVTIEGTDKKEHTCEVAKDAKITCNGKVCKLEDLKKGVKVKVTVAKKMATKIEATTK
jgi:hypothetical protein